MNRKPPSKSGDKRLPEALTKAKDPLASLKLQPGSVLGNRAVAEALGNGGGKDRSNGSGNKVGGDVQQALGSLGEGRALEGGAAAEASSVLGVSPTAVQIHDGPDGAALARQHNARAVTIGNHIAFGAGEYKPGTLTGDAILAHELAHVAQQRGADIDGPAQAPASEEALERDATQSAIGAMGQIHGVEAASQGLTHAPARPGMQSGLRLARCGKDKEAERKSHQVLTFIQTEAKKRAANPPTLSPSSNFYKRLKDNYLADYLKNPTEAEGAKAIGRSGTEGIGRAMKGRRGPGGIEVQPKGGAFRPAKGYWEPAAIETWNKQPIEMPEQIRSLPLFKNIKSLPPTLEAGTDVLIDENVKELPFVDSPFLLGKPNLATAADFDADWKFGGQNISQLMHWATGVKYSGESADAMHELFLAYEMWHLEGFDVFGQDALNDMIAEEQGRLLGVELAKGSKGAIKGEKELLPFLDRSFRQSRAWVGSLLRLRRKQLDEWILAEDQPKANFWYDKKESIWPEKTVYAMLAGGMKIADVQKSDLVQAQIEIYTLLYEADLWEKAEGKINITPLQKALVEGQLNSLLKVMAKGPKATSGDKLDAYTNLKKLKGS